jgi:hypothetical protein
MCDELRISSQVDLESGVDAEIAIKSRLSSTLSESIIQDESM